MGVLSFLLAIVTILLHWVLFKKCIWEKCRKTTALLTCAPAVQDTIYICLVMLLVRRSHCSCMLQKHGAPEHLLPGLLHWCFPCKFLHSCHCMNGSDPIITGLILKVSGTACILLNGKFIVCIEQLEHTVHIIAIYLGWNTETV